MTGWKISKEISELSDSIIGMLETAPKSVRDNAWHWIVFHMFIEHELDTKSKIPINDDTIEVLSNYPKKLESYTETLKRLLVRYENDIKVIKEDLKKLEEIW
jgi:hypothetical protein